VKEQMLMLTEHDVETHFITSTNFKAEVPIGVTVHAVLPYNNVKLIRESCWQILACMDNVLTHDIVYLNTYKDHELALREIAEANPHIRWLHWSHSAPNMNDKKQPFPNSIYISMNRTDMPLVAEQYGIPETQVHTVYNSVSPDVFFDWHPFTKTLVEEHKLLDCDILITYPLDTGRFEPKGGFKIIKLVNKIRKQGKNAKVIFINAAANTKERTQFVKALSNEYTIFTSLENKKYVTQVPRQVVRDLMQISNLFPLLSISEGCSLIMLEAALTKNLVILNEDFPPLKEFGEIDTTLYMKVSSTRCKTEYNPSEDAYYQDWARIIINKLETSQMNRFNRKVLRMFNRKWIWNNQLAPLLHATLKLDKNTTSITPSTDIDKTVGSKPTTT
jgi:hypothetical protein